ncbi:MAG: D-alanyl-D-alanine carboxypeptidase, partial [Planctomycetota bacterium]
MGFLIPLPSPTSCIAGVLRVPRGLPLIVLVALFVAVPADACFGDDRLRNRLATLLEGRTDLQGATVGVHVREAMTDGSLFARGASRPLLPASNMKLLTTGAALLVLGPDMRFDTDFRVRDGQVIVVGSGDPAFGDPSMLGREGVPESPDALLDELARAIVADGRGAGIETVIVDDRVFDRRGAHPSWPRDQLNLWYCAEVAGVN